MNKIYEALLLIILMTLSPNGENGKELKKLEAIPIFASVYDPAYCYDEDGNVIENINCDSDPSMTGSGYPVALGYSLVIACPRYMENEVIEIPGIGKRVCWDTGGAIRAGWRTAYTPEGFVEVFALTLDFLEPVKEQGEPYWAYALINEWEFVNGLD